MAVQPNGAAYADDHELTPEERAERGMALVEALFGAIAQLQQRVGEWSAVSTGWRHKPSDFWHSMPNLQGIVAPSNFRDADVGVVRDVGRPRR